MNSDPQSFFVGMDGFYWFIAVIENLEDPLKVGRAQARIIGWHDADKAKLATAELPWAYPIMPITGARTMPNYRIGDWVVGFFLDGKLGQQPMIFGVLPAVPTVGSAFLGKLTNLAKDVGLSYFGVPPGTI